MDAVESDVIRGHDIVCLSFVTWDDHWGASQQWMSRLAKHNRVLFVDQPISPLSFFTGIRDRSAVARQFRRWREGCRRVAPNVFAAAPPPILPLRYHQPFNTINRWILRRWLKRQAASLGFHRPIFWNFQPSLPGIASGVDPSLTLYHCVDEFAAVPHWWHSGSAVRAREIECCRESDVVLCTGRKLTESRRAFNPNVHFVPEAADIELFSTALSVQPDPAIATLPGKVIGYIGVIDFRLDVDLLSHLAMQQPDWSFALVGPVKGDVGELDRLKELPNVHVFGPQPIERLPSYLRGMDVCTIPYVLNDYTHHIFPLKLYEYMAAGKPIVSTNMDEMSFYAGETLSVARTHDDFLRAVREALAGDSPERVAKRVEASANESWDARIEQASAILEPMLAERGNGTDVITGRAEALVGS